MNSIGTMRVVFLILQFDLILVEMLKDQIASFLENNIFVRSPSLGTTPPQKYSISFILFSFLIKK